MQYTTERFMDIDGCLRLTNGTVDVVITTGFGPRILFYGYSGGQNFFKTFEEHLSHPGGKTWKSYGGHRLWHAPEVSWRTYYPDNDPVEYRVEGDSIVLESPIEKSTGMQKRIKVTLDTEGTGVTLHHSIFNRGMWDVSFAAWCLSVMAPGGTALIPQEVYKPHPDYLLPARPLVLWHFTNMNDPRFVWGDKYIQMRQDPEAETKQKIGALNTKGWAAYALNDELFIKRFPFHPGAEYPDYNSNTELYTEAAFLEVESLSPFQTTAPGDAIEHTEKWELHKFPFDGSEKACQDIEALLE